MELPPIEEALRLRAHAGGQPVPSSLPEGEVSWTQKLCWDERRRRFGGRSVVAGGMYHSVFLAAPCSPVPPSPLRCSAPAAVPLKMALINISQLNMRLSVVHSDTFNQSRDLCD